MKIRYPTENIDEIIDKLDKKCLLGKRNTTTVKIMVGHQGNSGEHHVELVRQLLKFPENNMRIYLPLSYGNQTYISKVIEELNTIGDDRVIPMTEFLSYDKYLNFLADIDVALIDELSSMALGNLAILVHLKKKIFLHRDGISRDRVRSRL